MRTIFTGFSPNTTKRDLSTASKFLFLPWKWLSWKKGKAILAVEDFVKDYFSVDSATTFDSARTVLYFSLKSFGLKSGDEVLVQAYTCAVVINAIKWSGATPIFVDINGDFNIDITDAKKKVSAKTKILIIQHTFGKPADIKGLLDFANEYKLKTIEDCAHVFGGEHDKRKLGTFADVGVFSFGSDKPISCVRGGVAITNNMGLADKLKNYQSSLGETSFIKIAQHLLHYPIFAIGKKTYSFKIGKLFLWLASRLHFLNKIIYPSEKIGEQVSFYPTKLPNALAHILLDQLHNIEKINTHRQFITKKYFSNIKNSNIKLPVELDKVPYLRFPLLVKDIEKFKKHAKDRGLIVGDWYQSVVAPSGLDLAKFGYEPGFCKKAEYLSAMSVNLPTDLIIGNREVNKIIETVNSYDGN